MNKLIAFIDGSRHSASVCDLAAWMAGRSGAAVELVHVLGRRESGDNQDLSGNIGLGARSHLLEKMAELDAQRAQVAQKQGRALLEEGAARVAAAGVETVTHKLRNGDLLDTLHDFEKEATVFLIGKRGEAARYARDHLGSNLERVVRASSRPVMVVTEEIRPVRRFLLAYDGGRSARAVVDHVANSPVCRGLECHLLAVSSDPEKMRKPLAEAESRLQGAGFTVETAVLPGEPPEDVIRNAIQERDIDLLAMGAYGHSRVRNLIIGSTTTALIRSSPVPVMLFK